MKTEINGKEIQKMIIMNIKLDNFMAFDDFNMNLSYPKKLVNPEIEEEFLKNYPNFRYRKVNIIMGANATGKTSFGKMLMHIFNFMDKKHYTDLIDDICDKTKDAMFCIDFVANGEQLYRVRTVIKPAGENKKYELKNIDVTVKSINIQKKDNYERCIQRLEESEQEKYDNYLEELEKVTGLSWSFAYPEDYNLGKVFFAPENEEKFLNILKNILQALDPAIIDVDKLKEVKGAYAIRTENKSAIIQNGEVPNIEWFSSGTKAGITIAMMLSRILSGNCDFFYCDEKFSYIHTDIEKAILSVMIDSLNGDTQFFFTTHNTDILDMQLPKHAYTFMRKSVYDGKSKIECINAGDIMKKNTESLKAAVENDLFSTAPATELIYDILDL